MKACLEVWKNEGKEFSDIRVALDWIKYNVRFFSVQYAKELTKIKREKEESPEETPSCTYKISTEPLWRIWRDSEQVQTWVAKVFDDKADWSMMRSRGRWLKYGEKNTKYFFKLGEKKPYKETY